MKIVDLMKKLLLVLCLAVTSLHAQDIYFCEIGVGGGGAFYLGDANGTLFKDMGPAGEAFFRYKFNGHWALKAQYVMGNAGIGRFDDVYRSTTQVIIWLTKIHFKSNLPYFLLENLSFVKGIPIFARISHVFAISSRKIMCTR